MLSIYSSRFGLRGGGRPSATWVGLPTIDEILEGYGNNGIECIVLEVELGAPLPAHRINTYYGDVDGIEGSYDGRTVRVCCMENFHSRDEDGEKLRRVCEAIIALFFDIIHGRSQGERTLNSDPAYYGGVTAAADDNRPHGTPLGNRTGSALGC